MPVIVKIRRMIPGIADDECRICIDIASAHVSAFHIAGNPVSFLGTGVTENDRWVVQISIRMDVASDFAGLEPASFHF